MKTRLLLSVVALTFCFTTVSSQGVAFVEQQPAEGWIKHPWQGKRVGYIGDSITDPKCHAQIKKYWAFLQDWLGITPYVYGVSGRQWNDVPRQAEKLKAEHGDEVDAVIVFIGTNDFNHGVPVGEWFTEADEEVLAARGEPATMQIRRHRTPVMADSTYRGRINQGIVCLKKLFPDKQIVLMTPIHRSLAHFNDKNVQPDENYQNRCGEYLDAYVQSVREAGSIWSLPVIDLNSVCGLNPMIEEQIPYFRDAATDRLHPSIPGQERMAKTMMYQLLTLPATF